MTGTAIARSHRAHLFGALIACAIPIVIMCGGRVLAIYLEEKTIHTTAPKDFFIKNQGLAFQRAAARTPDVLLLYGSSELTDPVINRASDFFSTEPSGFQVCPVGRAGTTSLNVLQKLGALGADLRGRKVAISLSPSSFLTPAVNPYFYAGNFSLPAASGILFGDALNRRLKAEIANRMLQFPDTLAKSALLELAAGCLASGRPVDRLVLMAISPLGKLQNMVLDLQDHFEALVYILSGENPVTRLGPRQPRLRKVRSDKHADTKEWPPATRAARDAAFRARIATAGEWTDLELLFRILEEAGAQPLILSMPIDNTLKDTRGVSRLAYQAYYDKLAGLTQRYHVPLVDFEDHDSDPTFLVAHTEHPSPSGWRYYDQALDDFFHKINNRVESPLRH